MRFVYIWGIVLAVIAVMLGLFLASLRQSAGPNVDPQGVAEKMRLEAARLKDSAATLRAAWRSSEASLVEARAVELAEQASLVGQAQPEPARKLSEEFGAKSRVLADSATRLRNAFLLQNDSLSASQERRIARIERISRELRSLARKLGSWGLNTPDQVQLYNSCVLTYGEGTRVCEELREEAPPGH